MIIDIGYKSEGFIPIEEFSGEEIRNLQVGADLDVFVEKIEDAEGMLTLSKERATKIKVWEMLENALRDGSPVEGKIVGKTKGGVTVDISGVTAFLPGSQVDIKPLKDIDTLVGSQRTGRHQAFRHAPKGKRIWQGRLVTLQCIPPKLKQTSHSDPTYHRPSSRNTWSSVIQVTPLTNRSRLHGNFP